MFLNDNTSVVAFVSDGDITSTSFGTLPIPAIPNICNQVGSTADASVPVMDPANCTLADNNVSRVINSNSDSDDNFIVPGRDVYFKLGELQNTDSDGDIEYVVIEFNALVHNDDYGSTPDWNRAGDLLGNRHRVYVNGAPEGGISSYVYVRVAEPVIDVAKTITGTPPDDAGDPIVYEIIFSNTASGNSSATAYDLQLTDTFDTNLESLSISSVATSQGGVCLGDGSGTTVYSHTESLVGGVLTVDLTCLDAGENITITVSGNVVDNVLAATTIYNSAIGTGTSLEGTNGTTSNSTGSSTPGATGTDTGERDGSDTDTGDRNDYYDEGDANHAILAPDIDKFVQPPAAWTIGESFTYDLVITLPDGVTPDMVVFDDIPPGLEFMSYNLISTSAAGGSRLTADFDGTLPAPVVTAPGRSGGDLTLNFGDTTTNEEYPNNADNNSFQVQVTVRMLNVIGNQNGDILTNQGELQYSSGTTATGTVDITVLEPVLVVDKTVNDDTPVLGQTITYSLEIGHDLDGLGEDSTSDAYNVRVIDTLPVGMNNIANITTSSTGGCATGFNTAASTATTLDVTINEIPYSLPSPGCVATITFEATIDTLPAPTTPAVGAVINNTADITWTSLSVSNGHERSGDGVVGNVDDYETDDTQSVTITNPDLRISKDDGTTQYIPGTSTTYTIIVENVGNEAANGAEVSDTRPALISTWAWNCVGATNGATGCTPAANSANDFSDFINLPANSSITYQVIANIPSSTTGNLTNTAEVIIPAGQIEPTPADNIDSDTDGQDSHADLAVDKDDGVTIISPGTTLTYTILVSNLSPSDVANATFEDLIPAEIVSWTWTCTHAGGASGCTPAASNSSDFTDTVNLPAGSSITYTVTALTSATASGTLTNTATINVPVGVTDDDTSNNTDNDVDGFPENNKNLISLLHAVTTLPDVAVGEILTYEVTLTVPPGSMTNTHLVDTLDLGLAYVTCESISAGSVTTSIPGGFASVCANPVVNDLAGGSPDNDGRQVDFDFDTLTNPNAPGGANMDLVILYQVVVLDSLSNQSGSTPLLVNDAEWVWDSGQLDDQAVGVNI